MDAPECSVPSSVAEAENMHLASEDVDGAKSSQDVKEVMQNNNNKHDKSTSTSATTIGEENVQKAISFLRNQQIEDISPIEKRRYLESKGINQDEIETALDRLAGSRTQGRNHRYNYREEGRPYHQHQQQHGPYGGSYQNHMQPLHNNNMYNYAPNNVGSSRQEEGSDSSLFSFSSWAGGFCMSTFSLAALRWLNGGDFVLFPPPIAAANGNSMEHAKQSDHETQSEENDEDGECSDHVEEASFNSQESGDPNLSMILDGNTASHNSDPHANSQEQSSFQDLVMEVKALSTTINSFREEQDRANRVATARLGKGVTDDAMDFLRQQKPPVGQKKGGVTAIENRDFSRITCLVTEMTNELSQVKDSLEQVVVEGGNAETEQSDEKINHAELSSKIDVAIEKGNQILALVHSPDESSSVNTESQMAPSAEDKNTAKDSDQGSNGTNHEENKDGNDDKTAPDPAPSTRNDSADISDQSSMDLEEALKKLSQNNDSEELKVGAQMLYLYCKNLSKNPTVPRYRKIYTNNNSFKNKVGKLVGAKEFLTALGFVERTSFFEWSETTSSSDTQSQLEFALVALELLQKGQVGDGCDTSEDKSK